MATEEKKPIEKKIKQPKKEKLHKKEEAAKPVNADKVYTIPMREPMKTSRRVRSNAGMKYLKKFLLTHTKADGVKIGKHLNEFMLEKSHRLPRKVRVNVFFADVDGEKIAKAELLGNAYEDFKAEEKKVTGGGMAEKLKARLGAKALKKQEETETIEGKLPEAPKEDKLEEKLVSQEKKTEKGPSHEEKR